MSSYFFACSYPLEPGSIVKPGNWGRMIKTYTPQSGWPWILIREMAYEEIREKEFPKKPSRFQSIFLCSTLDGLKKFIIENRRQFDIAYEVELADSSAAFHVGCLNIPSIADSDNYATFLEKARSYWLANDVINPEFITLSSVRIVRQL